MRRRFIPPDGFHPRPIENLIALRSACLKICFAVPGAGESRNVLVSAGASTSQLKTPSRRARWKESLRSRIYSQSPFALMLKNRSLTINQKKHRLAGRLCFVANGRLKHQDITCAERLLVIFVFNYEHS